jgi:hypothetical protein
MSVRRVVAAAGSLLLAAILVAANPNVGPTAYDRTQDARIAAIETLLASSSPTATASPPPTSSPTPAPTSMPSSSATAGWTLVFADDYSRWDPARYFVYPSTWTNGYTGHYDPSIIASDGSKLRLFLHTDQYPRIAAFCPIPTGSLSSRGDLASMRVEFRLRADLMPGYKGVPLLWPQSGNWPADGEIDGPESTFDTAPKAYMHRQGATSGGDQDVFNYPAGTSWQAWHTYATEWVRGQRVEFFIDGVSIGRSTNRVPIGPMHLVMQFETQLSTTPPDPSVSGFVEIDDLRVFKVAA